MGAICPTCLPKFSVNFRRPYKVLESSLADVYHGDYGFDWIRDEYFNKLLIKEKGGDPETVFLSKNKSDKDDFLSNYLNDSGVWGREFYLSYLWIFPENIVKINKYSFLKYQVPLNLELHMIDQDIFNKNFYIKFSSSNENLKIKYKGAEYRDLILHFSEIPLSGKRELYEKSNKGNGKKIRDYFLIESLFEVFAKGSGFNENESINVYVGEQKDNIENYVGGLIVSKNRTNKKAKTKVVKVIDNIDFKIHNEIDLILREKVLGQALIEVEYLDQEIFDLNQYYKADLDVRKFVNKFHRKIYKDADGNVFLPKVLWENYMDDLAIIYKKIKKLEYDIGSPNNPITYLFFTNVNPASIFNLSKKIALIDQGVSLGYIDEKNEESSGNQIVMFKSALMDENTIIHEVTHSFNAPHPFERENFSLAQGFTDLVLDYNFFEKKALLNAKNNSKLYMDIIIDEKNLLEELPIDGKLVLDLSSQVAAKNQVKNETDLYYGETKFAKQNALNLFDIDNVQNDYSSR